MNPKQNIEALLPSPNEASATVRAADKARDYNFCPNGHVLPHRTNWGRCSPVDCVDGDHIQRGRIGPNGTKAMTQPGEKELDLLPQGADILANTEDVATPIQAASVEAKADEGLQIAQAVARRAVRLTALPGPEYVPPKEQTAELNGREWIKERMNELAPLAIHELEFQLLFGSMAARADAAKELLDRAGHTRRPEQESDKRGPVIVLNLNATLPYDAQNAKRSVKRVIDVDQQLEIGPGRKR